MEKNNEKHKGKHLYLRPSEILERNPELKEYWTAQHIGWLLSLGFVDGYRGARESFVLEQDVLEVFRWFRQKQAS